ncbi:MAG TPA: hypothetical protein VH682_15890 [Gemmataceae bacterium]
MEIHERSFVLEKRPGFWRFWLKRLAKVLLLMVIVGVCAQLWRHYRISKRLEETLADIDRAEPGWRLQDIEAAREQIPEEENSARVVVAATKLLPPNWPPKEFDELFSHLAPEEQLAAEDFARLKQELDNVRPALEEARKLAIMPRGRHHIKYERNVINTLLNDQAEGRRITRMLVLDALRLDQECDFKNALISCRAVLNTARALGDEPMAVSQLVRTACVILACQSVERALAQGEPPPKELADFQKWLDDEDVFPDLLITARGERAANQETFDALESGDSPISSLSNGRPDWNERLFGFLYRDNIRDEHPTMLALMSQWVAIATLPSWEQSAAEQQFNQNIRDLPKAAILTRLLLPALTRLGEASRRKHAYLRCLNVALAAERYRREKKTWPNAIDQLCPKYLETVPLDPFDGQSLRYRRLEDGVMVYAVSNDGVDDGGNLDREHPNQPGVDIGYRLWDVAKRRQPARPKPPKPPAPPLMRPPAFNPG